MRPPASSTIPASYSRSQRCPRPLGASTQAVGTALILLAAAALSGCGLFSPADGFAFRDRSIGCSVEGRPIDYEVFGHGGDVILIMATIHGNESAGTPLVRRLAAHLRASPEVLRYRTVVLLPVANPDGLARTSRRNARGIDLNRDFPAQNHLATLDTRSTEDTPQPLSAPESRAIWRLIDRYQPDRVVSIHQPLHCIDYDGPAAALAKRMAAVGPLPVRKLGARRGSLGAYLGVDLQTPTITLELPRAADDLSSNELWDTYGPMLLAAIAHDR